MKLRKKTVGRNNNKSNKEGRQKMKKKESVSKRKERMRESGVKINISET